mmetsp:Transcript_53431/g.168157  ORF Transcript_53431/g.168157 Transcript_53431/m.168157 type:complete len:258 (-) Transcript_53431:68-841(-)
MAEAAAPAPRTRSRRRPVAAGRAPGAAVAAAAAAGPAEAAQEARRAATLGGACLPWAWARRTEACTRPATATGHTDTLPILLLQGQCRRAATAPTRAARGALPVARATARIEQVGQTNRMMPAARAPTARCNLASRAAAAPLALERRSGRSARGGRADWRARPRAVPQTEAVEADAERAQPGHTACGRGEQGCRIPGRSACSAGLPTRRAGRAGAASSAGVPPKAAAEDRGSGLCSPAALRCSAARCGCRATPGGPG